MTSVWRRGIIFGVLLMGLIGWGATTVQAQNTTSSPWAGVWAFVSGGDDPGTGTATVDNEGNISGTGTTQYAGSITVSGTVADDGTFTFTGNSTGSASTGAQFSGKATGADAAAGTWVNSYSKQKGTWTAKRTSKTTTTTPANPATSEAPTTAPPSSTPVVGSDASWGKFRSRGSLARCYIERPLYPWNFNLLEFGIRFSWTSKGLFILETANASNPKTKSYAHLFFAVPNVKRAEGTTPAAPLSRKTNRYILDESSPIILDDPQRIVTGAFDNVQVTLTAGTKLFKRAVGLIEFASPNASGYCKFDLQTLKGKP
jgi:hypothetical protein